jgi:hypothetical protein
MGNVLNGGALAVKRNHQPHISAQFAFRLTEWWFEPPFPHRIFEWSIQHKAEDYPGCLHNLCEKVRTWKVSFWDPHLCGKVWIMTYRTILARASIWKSLEKGKLFGRVCEVFNRKTYWPQIWEVIQPQFSTSFCAIGNTLRCWGSPVAPPSWVEMIPSRDSRHGMTNSFDPLSSENRQSRIFQAIVSCNGRLLMLTSSPKSSTRDEFLNAFSIIHYLPAFRPSCDLAILFVRTDIFAGIFQTAGLILYFISYRPFE